MNEEMLLIEQMKCRVLTLFWNFDNGVRDLQKGQGGDSVRAAINSYNSLLELVQKIEKLNKQPTKINYIGVNVIQAVFTKNS